MNYNYDCAMLNRQDNYDKQFVNMVYSNPQVNLDEILGNRLPKNASAVRLEYNNLDGFRALTSSLGLMTDCKVFMQHDLILIDFVGLKICNTNEFGGEIIALNVTFVNVLSMVTLHLENACLKEEMQSKVNEI